MHYANSLVRPDAGALPTSLNAPCDEVIPCLTPNDQQPVRPGHSVTNEPLIVLRGKTRPMTFHAAEMGFGKRRPN